MSGGAGSRGDGVVSAAGIPAGSRKMVQSLKEIVNFPEQEIYATLKDCGMDPNEAVQRLLSQDSFHEVKSKRDKKKEVKELPETRTRPNNSTSVRGVRANIDRGTPSSFTSSTSNGFSGNRGKILQKKEDGICSVPSSSNMGSNFDGNKRSATISDILSTENQFGLNATLDGSSLHTQPSSGYQHGWAGIPGHYSMADIVKMGRPQQGKPLRACTATGNASHVSNQFTPDTTNPVVYSVTHDQPSEFDQDIHTSQVPQQTEDTNFELNTGNKHVTHDAWPSVTQPNHGITSGFLDTSDPVDDYADALKPALIDEIHFQPNLHDETPELEQSAESNTSLEQSVKSESLSETEIDEQGSEDEEANVEIASAAANLRDISIENDGLSRTTLEDNPAVIIPRHLQVTNAECSHLSFGSFSSGVSSPLPGSLQPKSLHSSPEVIKVVDVPLLNHSNSGNSNYYDKDDLKTQRNEDTVSRVGLNTLNYEMSSASEPDVIRDDSINSSHELQYSLPSLSGYGTSTSSQPSSTAFSHQQSNLQLHNLSSLSNLMHPYTGSLTSSLLAPTLPLRDLDLPFSSFLTTQSMSTKHISATPNNESTVPMQEAKPSVFSNLQQHQVPQSSPTPNLPAGHAIPQHLPLHPYSQPALPLGPFANVISYPFLPQSYTYMPSAAFPQAYTTNDPFHPSPSPVHNPGLKYQPSQYKNTLSQPTAAVSPYGNFSGSANLPGNFSLNPSTSSSSTNLGFAEALSSQYKEGAHYLPLQQNESSPMWVQGGNSRTLSPLPPNTFYSFQGQNQLGSFRQAQQPSHYGQMGYLNFFQNQLGAPVHEQQQNSSEEPQGNSSQQSHQLWQHRY